MAGMIAQQNNASAQESITPPVAKKVPHLRQFHGDEFNDVYEWMRDTKSEEVHNYVQGQNAYTEFRLKNLAALRQSLFDELKSRVKETDMSVPTRIHDYWYFSRVQQGKQYGLQCRIPVASADDWDAPEVDPLSVPGSLPGEQIVFDANVEAAGKDFFQLGGMDLSRDGRWLLYGVDTSGNERYDFRIRDLQSGEDLPDQLDGIGRACLTPDAQWVFYTVLDDAWRPYAVYRHRVGAPVSEDVEVFRESDERFWVGVGVSFDERNMVINTGSKTTSEVRLLPLATPEGEFSIFIAREEGIEYDVSFACFEGAGEQGEDVDVAIVSHNAHNPNFEIDVIDMRDHKPPFTLGEGVPVAVGSPYGCEQGDRFEPGARAHAISEPYFNPANPRILQGARGLSVDGLALYRHFALLSYRADGMPHIAMMTKSQAKEDFISHQPWRFVELQPHGAGDDFNGAADMTEAPAIVPMQLVGDADEQNHLQPGHKLYSVSASSNPSYLAPKLRYGFSSYTSPGELHEFDPATGEDVLLKRAQVLGDFEPGKYAERRIWVKARDGETIPVSLVWRPDAVTLPAPMFITGYGAYEISSDPGFSVARLSLLDRGVLYAVAHIRGGGEMGRAWYEQGRRLNKKHSFEDFVDATIAVQDLGYADVKRTVANGGSAGGLLMGAVANLAPERYAGIEADVPFVDALTSILDPSLPLTVTEWDEWGDPLHDEQVYRYMRSYTPYENAPSDEKPVHDFPAIFITSSMNDTRVLVVEPLKWLARLQSAGVDAIAKIEVEAGHGGVTGRYKQWEEVSYENAWCLSIMGIES